VPVKIRKRWRSAFPCDIRNYKTREWEKLSVFASLCKQGGVKMGYVTWNDLFVVLGFVLDFVGVLFAVLSYFKNNKR